MAKVAGIKEKLHAPIYDAFFVKTEPTGLTFAKSMTDPRMIRFFVDVQNKTPLETNVQAAGVLPSQNTFEARALRVVVSNLRVSPMRDNPEGEIRETLNESELLADLIYNSVTSLIVGEKEMIKMPTYWFPAGAGVSPGFPNTTNHGMPSPEATFRFAAPILIEPQQNFRVEMSFPHGVPGGDEPPNGVVKKLAHVTGPFRIWVVLDGYLTRDVQ
jgi:hypothetical protein